PSVPEVPRNTPRLSPAPATSSPSARPCSQISITPSSSSNYVAPVCLSAGIRVHPWANLFRRTLALRIHSEHRIVFPWHPRPMHVLIHEHMPREPGCQQ